MKTTDALVESEQFQDFLYAMQRGEAIAPCPYCGWSCVVNVDLPTGVTMPFFKEMQERGYFEERGGHGDPGRIWPIVKQINCPNCKRATEFAVNYVEEQEAVQ